MIWATNDGAAHVTPFSVTESANAARARFTPSKRACTFASPGGVTVVSVDQTGDGLGDYIGGAGTGSPPLVHAATVGDIDLFYAFDPAFVGGVYVAAGG